MKTTDPRTMTPAQLAKAIDRKEIAARDRDCPRRRCWQLHEWSIRTHGAMQTNGRREWRCCYRERDGCPSPIPAPAERVP